MKIIGVTGGIGSGKTTVLNLFEQFDIPVYNSDVEARRIMNTSKDVIQDIITLFGADAYVDKVLNKSYISTIVFEDKHMLNLLNKIVHPAVRNDFFSFVKCQKAPYLIYESALLMESDLLSFFDKVILVDAPVSERVKRVQKRDNLSVADIKARIDNQIFYDAKSEKIDIVLSNISLAKTKKEVFHLHERFMK